MWIRQEEKCLNKLDVVPEFHATAQLRVAADNVPGNILNIDIGAVNVMALFIIAPTLKLIPGSKIENNNPSAMLVGYDIANPPGYLIIRS